MADLTETVRLLFFNDTATTEIYALSLHDALPIFAAVEAEALGPGVFQVNELFEALGLDELIEDGALALAGEGDLRSEEHTSELQSRQYLVCRLLLEQKSTTTCRKTRPQLEHSGQR